MERKDLVEELNSVLQFAHCNICPLQDACLLYEDMIGTGNSICNLLSDEIGCEE